MDTLIIIDLQNDFLSGGTLAVPGAESIIPVINNIQHHFPLVIATQDWHPNNHISFASSHPGRKPFQEIELNGVKQMLWPTHCVQSSFGASLHKGLDQSKIETIFRKGTDLRIDSYSGFFDNGKEKQTGMEGYLRNRGCKRIFVAGLAGDVCVYHTAIDGLELGFEVHIIEDACRAIDSGLFQSCLKNFRGRGGKLVTSAHLT